MYVSCVVIFVGTGGICEYVVCLAVGVWNISDFFIYLLGQHTFGPFTFENACNNYSLFTQSSISGSIEVTIF